MSIFFGNAFEDDGAGSTDRYTTSSNVDMTCRKIHEILVIGYHPTGDILPLQNKIWVSSSKFWIQVPSYVASYDSSTESPSSSPVTVSVKDCFFELLQ